MPPPNVCLFSDPVVRRLAALDCGRRAGISYATGKRIQQLRKANGMTQEQFAIELNTSDRHIRRIERGEETPSIDLYVEMVATFNTSLDYLLLGKAPSEREEQLKRQLYAKLHRIARNLDEIARDL